MIVSAEGRFVFIHVQKTGGVSVETALTRTFPDARSPGLAGRRHAGLTEAVETMPEIRDYYSFGFVRNPWARLYSWHAMVVRRRARADAGNRSFARRLRKNAFWAVVVDELLEFEDFVLRGPDLIERLRTPQVEYLTASGRRADFIGRTESLADDLAQVFADLRRGRLGSRSGMSGRVPTTGRTTPRPCATESPRSSPPTSPSSATSSERPPTTLRAVTDAGGQPTLVLGVGAQKAGTTWLHRYLESSPAFAAGFRKEYHVFDTIDVPSAAWSRDRAITLAEQALTDLKEGLPADAEVLHLLSMCGNPTYYYDYFSALLRRDPRRRVTADITPAYALLSEPRFREIRQEFGERGVRTVPVFVMRDPVERIWSQARMQHQRADAATGSAEDLVRQRYADEAFAARSEYHRTIDALDAAFGEDVHYAFYERLFTDESVAALCAAIGIAPHPARYDDHLNAARGDEELPESLAEEIATHLAEVYRKVAARFPEVDLGRLWPTARFAL